MAESLKTADPVANMQLMDFQEGICLDLGWDSSIAAALGVEWEQLLQHMVDSYTDGDDDEQGSAARHPLDRVWDAAYTAGPGREVKDTDWGDNRRGGEDMDRSGLRLSAARNHHGAFWVVGVAVGDAGGFAIFGHGMECSYDAAKSRAEDFADSLSATLPAAVPAA